AGVHRVEQIGAVLLDVAGERALCGAVGEDLAQRHARLHQLGRKTVHLDVAAIEQAQALVVVGEAHALRHVIERRGPMQLLPAQPVIGDGGNGQQAERPNDGDQLPALEKCEHVQPARGSRGLLPDRIIVGLNLGRHAGAIGQSLILSMDLAAGETEKRWLFAPGAGLICNLRAANKQGSRGEMAEDTTAATDAAPAVSQEQLRKAEAYVEAEEGVVNRLAGWAGLSVTAIAVAMTLFHLYAAYDIVPTQPLRYTHVAFVMVLCFLSFPLTERFRNRVEWFDVIAAAASVAILVYAIWGGEDFTDRATTPTRPDVTLGVIFIVLLLEATRRTSGWIMPFVAILFIVYAMTGPYLPPPWTHRGYDLSRLVGHLFITLEGIFGVAVDVSSTLIIMFT